MGEKRVHSVYMEHLELCIMEEYLFDTFVLVCWVHWRSWPQWWIKKPLL